MKYHIAIVLITIIPASILGQTLDDLLAERPILEQPTLVERLNEEPAQRTARLEIWEISQAAWVEDMAAFLGFDDVSPSIIWDFDATGIPIFQDTSNVRAAASNNSHVLQRSPLNIVASDEVAGVWEPGVARDTHVEFTGSEGTSRVTVMNIGANFSDHATHVTETIAAAGLDTNAQGMAPAASVRTWDSASIFSEMTTASATSTTDFSDISLSNHSFGEYSGWGRRSINGVNGGMRSAFWHGPVSSTGFPHFNTFGSYSKYSEMLDDQMFTSPDHLIVRAAGNDRDDGPPEQGTIFFAPSSNGSGWAQFSYDPDSHPPADASPNNGYYTIGPSSSPKNPLIVGAWDGIMDQGIRLPRDAQPSTFTGFGSTRDGRIKPEVVAQGVDLYSTEAFTNGNNPQASNTQYGIKSGTSMASPTVVGVATQLQSLSRRLFSERLTATEMKGLLIHTADDVGLIGPDYQSGFGCQMNWKKVRMRLLLRRTQTLSKSKTLS